MSIEKLLALTQTLRSWLDIDYKEIEEKKIDYYKNLYFATKKRKDLRRKAKTRMLKSIEGEWKFWKRMQNWNKEF